MPRKHSRRSMKGGFLEGLTNSLSGLTNSLSNTTSSWGNSLKNTTSSWGDKLKKSIPSVGSSSSSTSVSSVPSYTPRVGGRKRRSMRGGDFIANTPTTGLAFHAAPFSGETARPNTWVGGKTKKRRKHSKRTKSHRKR